MDCCDDYGRCVQTGDCPARAATPPAPRARMTCDERGVCNGTGNCPGCARPIIDEPENQVLQINREGGNFWLHNTEPPEQLTLREVVAWCLFLLVCGGACAAVVGFATGWTMGSIWP